MPPPRDTIDRESHGQAQAINPQPPMAQECMNHEHQQEQEPQQQQQQPQQLTSAQTVLESAGGGHDSGHRGGGGGGGGESSQPSTPGGFLQTVREAASKTTELLGIGSGLEGILADRNHGGSSSGGGKNGSISSSSSRSSGLGEANETASGSRPSAQLAITSPLAPSAVPPSSLPSTPTTAATTAPPSPQSSSTTPLARPPTTTSSSPSPSSPSPPPTTKTLEDHPTTTTTTASAPVATADPYSIMNPAQSDLMTIESFQMNGGPFNYESQDYSADPANVAGPGSFPDSDTNGNGSSYDPNGDTASRGHDSSEDGYGDVNSAFIYANEKRFSDFHALFRSVPDDEKLIEDYGCALQKEILVQGRLYISENHLCFNANIFGWVTNLVIAFSEITAIEKRLTAFVIPNAISIMTSTNTKGHFFASFLSRDAAYDLLMAAWRKSFPCAANASALTNNIYFRQNRSNVTLNEDDTNNTDAESFISARPTSDSKRNRHRRSSSGNSQNWTADEADWDEFEDTDGAEGHSGRGRSVSELPPPPSSYDFGTDSDGPSKARANKGGDHKHSHSHESKVKKPNGGAGANNNNNANSSRAPTTCKCSKDGRHYANTYMSETFPGSVESMWKLLFESDFSKSFLTNEVMKGADVQEEAWQKGADGILTKTTKYTKWLGLPIGPKTTKAILTDVCENKDFDQYVTTVTTTSTPDVPSGGCFTTKCRTCITWAGPNQVKILVTGAVEFTKSSWIKGQIEKGAADGMTAHYKELNQCIRKYIATHPDEFAGAGDTGAPAAVAENKTRTSSSRSRTKSNGDDLASEKAKRAAEVLAPVVSLPVKDDKATKSSSGGMSGILSSIMGMFSFGGSSSSSSDGEGASHVALIAVLVVVMAANLYIWIQISNVTTQIERIQGDVFRGNHHKNNNVYVDHQDQHQHAVGEEDYYYDSYSREQEEAMWAWLTEREERHRQHQRASTHGQGHAHKDWIRASSPSSPSSSSPSSSSYPKSSAEESEENAGSRHHDTDRTAKFDDLSATEAKLQARINELQQQLETLERALESGRM